MASIDANTKNASGMTMSDNTAPGERVVFNHPHRGKPSDKAGAKMQLTVGREYTVLYIKRSIFSTRVFLQEVPIVSWPLRMFENISKRNPSINGMMQPNTRPYGVTMENI